MRTVATAGHVDHGKSSLVLALTGTDPDRFAEEKARGLTIDLGFAFTTLPSGVEIGFVDVPGHTRFLKNMLAGVGAVEVALLVVAADDGWMPQSEEHLQILELLGVTHGVVVLTKADTVDADTLELAQLELAERLARSDWRDAPVVLCDAVSGRGLDLLRRALDDVIATAPSALDRGRPRLWIDRAFAARGAGTVVTGTLAGGALRTGDALVVARTGAPARVRGIQSGHRPREQVEPGARVALNLAGVEHRGVVRGDALVRSTDWVVARVVDVSLDRVPADALPRRCELLAYAGSGEHHVTFRRLGHRGDLARISFATPVALAPGDHLVLRDSGTEHVVGGATVLDVDPAGSPREAAARLALPFGRRLLRDDWPTVDDLARRGGLDATEAAAVAASLVERGDATRVSGRFVATERLDELITRTRALVEARHRERPHAPGLELATLASALGVELDVARGIVERGDGLVVDREFVSTPDHVTPGARSPEGIALIAALDATPFAPPDDAITGADPALVRALVRDGVLVDVGGIVFTRAAVDRARTEVRDALHRSGSLTVGDVRAMLGTSRKYAVPMLEHFDREGVTRRRGDARIAGPGA